jgi:serpin B
MEFGEWLRRLFSKSEAVDEPLRVVARPDPVAMPTSFDDCSVRFSLALYDHLRRRPGNLCFSPYSIRAALGMALVGARGDTAEQMAAALCAPRGEDTLPAAVAALGRRLHGGSRQYTLSVANSLWAQQGTPLLPAFLDIVERHYRGALQLVDFKGAPDAAGAVIDRWVAHETHGRISGLVPPGATNERTRLLLVNAVYLKARWASEFCESATSEQPFHLESGGRVRVPLMCQQTWAGYLHASGFEALDLPYRGDDLSLLVLLPERSVGLRAFEETLSAALLDDVVARMREQEVDVFLPRFMSTWGAVDLRGDLAALGMRLAFDATGADFSGMDGRRPPDVDALYLSAVVHKTFIEVNERGTEAAAATAAMTDGDALEPPPIPVFRADRPFLYAIRDRRSGVLLFLGRVVDPTEGRSP